MAKTNAERVAEHRRRRKAAGLSTITVVVPEGQVEYIRELARQLVDEAAELSGRSEEPAARAPSARAWTDRISREVAAGPIKPGQLLAAHIGTEIAASGWQAGQSLGSEEALRERFGVGRNIMREAIRILEHHGIARMQRGAIGGLVVTIPNLDNALYGLGVYLTYAGITPAQLLETRRILELESAVLAAQRVTAEGLESLQAAVEVQSGLSPSLTLRRLEEFHRALAALTQDPALAIFIESIMRLLRQPVIRDPAYELHWELHNRDIVRASNAAHKSLAKAVAAGDAKAARRHMAAYLKAGEAWWLLPEKVEQ